MKIEGAWEDINDKGYVIIRDFLPASVLQGLIDDAQQPDTDLPVDLDPERDPRQAAVLSNKAVAPAVFARLQAVVEAAFPELNAATGMSIDTAFPAARWFRNGISRLHTDSTPFYMWQGFRNYINFWMPVIKPHHDKAGLAFVPLDTWREVEPEAARKMQWLSPNLYPKKVVAGGTEAIEGYSLDPTSRPDVDPMGPQALMVEQDGHLRPIMIDVDPEDLVIAPPIGPGDVIISRADILHRSQDAVPGRLSVSVRCFDGSHTLRKEWLQSLSLPSRRFVTALSEPLGPFVAAYEHYGVDEITRSQAMRFVIAAMSGTGPEAETLKKVLPQIPSILDVPPPPGRP